MQLLLFGPPAKRPIPLGCQHFLATLGHPPLDRTGLNALEDFVRRIRFHCGSI